MTDTVLFVLFREDFHVAKPIRCRILANFDESRKVLKEPPAGLVKIITVKYTVDS